MEKIILDRNSEKANDAIRRINLFCTKINEILPEFKRETDYMLDMHDVKMLIEAKDQDPLIERVKKSMEKNLESFNQITRTILKRGIDEFVYGFAQKIQRIALRWQTEYLSDLSIENSGLYLSSEKEQEIRERFTDAITTEGGKQFYDLQIAAAKSLTDLSKFIKSNTSINYFSVAQMADNLFTYDNNNKKSEYLCITPKNLMQLLL